jgi:beta-glucosidase-like glycosyl hydrolase/CubicO group peptidase (beta-lactamase class C family)
LLISSDFERGLGMRLDDAVEFPYNMALGAANDPELTYFMGRVIAREGRALGFQQNFAPLLDVNHDYRNPIINIRAYSEDPNIIALHGTAFINGMATDFMLSTAKHFPGHGATDLDSHNELPVILQSKDEFYKNDLIPFKKAIKNGIPSVMIGHLDVPAFEKNKGIPATFSKEIVTELLQNKLNFKGLITTDAMNMHAITKKYSPGESAKLAVEAGNDLILYPTDEEAAINGLVRAVENGDLSVKRIDHSVRKILKAKKWLYLDSQKVIDSTKAYRILNSPKHKRLAEEIAEKSITLVKDENNLIPVDADKYYSITCINLLDVWRNPDEEQKFEEILKENFKNVRSYDLTLSSRNINYRRAFNLAKRSRLVLVPAYVNVKSFKGDISIADKHLEFIKKLMALNKPVVIMSFGSPYILFQFPEAETYLCAYGAVPISQIAMFNAVFGRSVINGKLPVSIPNTEFNIGYGIKKRQDKPYFPETEIDTNYNFSLADSLMKKALDDSVFPGAALLVGHRGKVIINKSYGRFNYDDKAKKITNNSIFDLASLTKVIGTTSAAMLLFDQGKLELDRNVSVYLPEFGANGKVNVTIRNLLLHNSGLPAYKPFYKMYKTKKEVVKDIMSTSLISKPGQKYLYSDLGMITLQLVIEKITGKPINEFLRENVFEPLGMNRTMYNPPAKLWNECVPTEKDNYWRMTLLKGKVHDETASLMKGVAGHAGLFSTSQDLGKFLFTFLNDGFYNGGQVFNYFTIEDWTSRQGKQSSRGLGWDTKSEKGSSAGNKFSKNSFGHTGFTGTSVWVDKDRDLFVVLLTNRVYPTRENRKIIKFRPKLHDAIIDAVDYF